MRRGVCCQVKDFPNIWMLPGIFNLLRPSVNAAAIHPSHTFKRPSVGDYGETSVLGLDAGTPAPPFGVWPKLCNCVNLHLAGEPRGRADTPGFDRWPDREGQQVTEVGVAPLSRNNTP